MANRVLHGRGLGGGPGVDDSAGGSVYNLANPIR
jgi:hypothetical protein